MGGRRQGSGLIEDGALNIVVVGGGPTGVETAGALAELYTGVFRRDYPDVAEDAARITLVEAGPEIFSMFKPDIRNYTVEALTKRGVEVTTGEVVESVTPLRVKLKSGKELKAHTLVWGAGLRGTRSSSRSAELEQGSRMHRRRSPIRRTRKSSRWATLRPSPLKTQRVRPQLVGGAPVQ